MEYVSEVTTGIDFTARDLQQKCKEKGLPWEISKAFDHSAVIGEWIPIEELNLTELHFHLNKNNQLIQKGNINEMIFPIQKIIAYLSIYFKLNKGDLIFTGTPAGVSSVQIGDILESFIGNRSMFRFEVK